MVNGVLAALRDVSLFSDLSSIELAALSAQIIRRRFGRNEFIFFEGDAPDGLYVVEAGLVSIIRASDEGDELILAVCEPGESFGELALLDEVPRSATASAMTDCITLYLSRAGFRSFLGRHPEAVFLCLQAIAMQLRRVTDLVDEIALLDVRTRLERCLLRLIRQGVVESEGELARGAASNFRITQQQLANMTGVTRESVNRHLQSLVEEGIVVLEGGHIRVPDVARLAHR